MNTSFVYVGPATKYIIVEVLPMKVSNKWSHKKRTEVTRKTLYYILEKSAY